jgi:hypothetical protein
MFVIPLFISFIMIKDLISCIDHNILTYFLKNDKFMRNCVNLLEKRFNHESWNDYVLAGPAVIGPNSPTLPSSAPTPLSPQGKYNTSK